MQSVTILTVGRLREQYLRDGCAEYIKRLSAFCKLSVIELPECRVSDNPSDRELSAALRREGEAILAKLPAQGSAVALCIEGRELSSPALAERLSTLAVSGTSQVSFIIGGSWGLCESVKAACALRLSLSPMTLPHQLTRLVLLEQLYRAFSINANGKYHK